MLPRCTEPQILNLKAFNGYILFKSTLLCSYKEIQFCQPSRFRGTPLRFPHSKLGLRNLTLSWWERRRTLTLESEGI
jgi:hypothetical protein